MQSGIESMCEIAEQSALKQHIERKLDCDAFSGQASLKKWIRERAETIYHPVGTCRMGKDNEAVVDPQLRVRGIDNLRVIDASILPTVISGNTNLPIMAMAEKAADIIRNGDSAQSMRQHQLA